MGEHVHSFRETPAKFQGGANAQTRGASCTARTVDNIKISERSNEAIEAVRPLNVYDNQPAPQNTYLSRPDEQQPGLSRRRRLSGDDQHEGAT